MRKEKILLNELTEVFQDNLTVNKLEYDLYFDIGDKITNDVGEAVCILMRKVDFNDPIWNTDTKNIDIYGISPEKSLFWLTGGPIEWDTLKNYKKPWEECLYDFKDNFGSLIINGVKKSRKLRDIRDYFLKYLNLPLLYDFAVSKGLIK